MTQVHRDGLLFKWVTKDYEIVVGFKRVGHGRCKICLLYTSDAADE